MKSLPGIKMKLIPPTLKVVPPAGKDPASKEMPAQDQERQEENQIEYPPILMPPPPKQYIKAPRYDPF